VLRACVSLYVGYLFSGSILRAVWWITHLIRLCTTEEEHVLRAWVSVNVGYLFSGLILRTVWWITHLIRLCTTEEEHVLRAWVSVNVGYLFSESILFDERCLGSDTYFVFYRTVSFAATLAEHVVVPSSLESFPRLLSSGSPFPCMAFFESSPQFLSTGKAQSSGSPSGARDARWHVRGRTMRFGGGGGDPGGPAGRGAQRQSL
jgi:uncharacterized membrane protein YgcG